MKLRRRIGGAKRFLESRFSDNSALLLYHRVADPLRDPFSLCVSSDHFAGQMESLRKIGNPLAIREFVERQLEGRLERDSLCVTFDDGYVDFLEDAVPILERFEIPAVIYCVASGFGLPLWWDRLLDSLYDSISLPDLLVSLSSRFSIDGLTGEKDLRRLFDLLYPCFRSLPSAERLSELDRIEKEFGAQVREKKARLMTESEIRSLASHPLITVGAHTVSHSSLAGLAPEDQFEEIDTSIREISRITGQPITSFSYPFGIWKRDYSEETIQAAKEAGLDHALAADQGVVSRSSAPFALPRLWIHDSGQPRFRRKLNRWL